MKGNQLVDLFGLAADPRSNEQASRLLLRLESEIAGSSPEAAVPPARITMRAGLARSQAWPDFEGMTDRSYIII